MRLHRARSVMIRSRARAARDRLVILVALVAEREIVHRPLARRKAARRSEQRVGDDLAGLDIPGDDRGGISRIEHRAIGHHQLDRPQAAVIHRDRIVDQRANDVERSRAHDRKRRVEIVRLLVARAGEIERRGAAALSIVIRTRTCAPLSIS